MNKPLTLLLVTGAALGLNFPLGKLVAAAGIDPLLWACYISLAAGLTMLTLNSAMAPGRSSGHSPLLVFSLISGTLSYVIPNGLTFFLIPKIGAGLAAIMFALSPVVTALLSLLLRVSPPSAGGLIGIALGLAGALVIIFGRGGVDAEQGQTWLILALLIPVFLGLGNVYRTMAWPAGAEPRMLAATTNLAAVLPLFAVGVWHANAVQLSPFAAQPLLMLAQLVVSSIMFLTFFRLQQVGGPTYLSQIGYVAAAVGLLIGVGLLGETYQWTVWAGAGTIAAGIAVSTLAQLRS